MLGLGVSVLAMERKIPGLWIQIPELR
ncbi:hypothetical protein SBV1_390024 [Verrucomicrobia bacterium]|nr:hypothetical protein SBV1_390024 [Verrucomicrobiota bacterium]